MTVFEPRLVRHRRAQMLAVISVPASDGTKQAVRWRAHQYHLICSQMSSISFGSASTEEGMTSTTVPCSMLTSASPARTSPSTSGSCTYCAPSNLPLPCRSSRCCQTRLQMVLEQPNGVVVHTCLSGSDNRTYYTSLFCRWCHVHCNCLELCGVTWDISAVRMNRKRPRR